MDAAIIFTAQYLIILLPLVLLQLLWTLPGRERTRFVVLSLCSLLLAFILAKICTRLYFDPRPFAVDNFDPLVPNGIKNGFPSLHTMFAATMAALVYTRRRLTGAALFLLAILIGVARVLAGVHHALDVVVGLLVALSAVFLARKLLEIRIIR